MSAARTDFRDIRAGLQSRALELARELVPAGRRNGNYWIAKNPTRDDRSAGSFYIWIKGAAAGGFRDDATGDKGDCIDLIAYVGRMNRAQAADWARKFLGWDRAKPEAIAAQARVAQARAREADAEEALTLERNRANAKAMWLGADRWTAGDPVDLYLRGRGISLEPGTANAIRYSPNMKHIESMSFWPCMIAAMSDASGGIVAVHRTWLQSVDGRWTKAPVEPQRKIWPAFRGAVIRLAKGASGLSPEQAEKRGHAGPCVICEGVEDGLSVAIARPDLRVWAAGSLGNLRNVPRLPCVSRFIVCQDNDWGKKQAQAQFFAACDELAATGVPVAVAASSIGKDVNDLLKGEA